MERQFTPNRLLCSQSHYSPPWLLALLLCLLLWGAVPNQASAQEDLGTAAFQATWMPHMGAYQFTICATDYTGLFQEQFQYYNVYIAGHYAAKITSSCTGYTTTIENRYASQDLVVDNGSWTQVAYGSSLTVNNTQQATNHRVTFYIYPDTRINQVTYVQGEFMVDIWYSLLVWGSWGQNLYDASYDLLWVYSYAPTLSEIEMNRENGTAMYNVEVENLKMNSSSVSTIDLRYATSEYGTYHSGEQIELTNSVPWRYIGSYLLDYASSDQQFADGLWFMLASTTDPDIYGGTYITPTEFSERRHTGTTAVMKDGSFTVTQNNRDIDLHWEVLQPTGNPSTQDMANFAVEMYQNGVWVELEEVTYDINKTAYSYTYTLSDDECRKGDVNYAFRVWKKFYNTQNLYSYRMSTEEITKTIYTNYKTAEITNISPSGSSSAVVTWSLSSNGLWDSQATLTLEAVNKNDPTVVITRTPEYNNTSQTIVGLSSCTTYDVTLTINAMGSYHHTSQAVSVTMADEGKRAINNLEVSKGYYNSYVRLSWEVPADSADFDYFEIQRRNIVTNETVSVAQISHVYLTNYSYQDSDVEAGIIHEYTVNGYASCDTGNGEQASIGASASGMGLSQPYASVSGRIAYEGTQAVPGVAVSVVGGDESSSNKSVYFDGNDATSAITLPSALIDYTTADAYTVQFWVKPSSLTVGTPTSYMNEFVFSKGCTLDFNLVDYAGGASNDIVLYLIGSTAQVTGISLPDDEWTHVTYSAQINAAQTEGYLKLYLDGKEVYSTTTAIIKENITNHHTSPFMMGGASDGTQGFRGNLDEIRVYNTALDAATIASNYDTYITGKESNLVGYYRCDEDGCNELFDISAVGSSYNKNDGKLGVMVSHSTVVPSTEQLSIKGITDEDGNYLITTIPYTSDGLQYNLVPIYGIHEFSPNKRPIYASPSSTVFNSIDFEDISSFPVSGVVYYEGTDYPVEGANLYIDGVICSSDGKTITTDSQGKFEISVPIGDHHISVEMQGHTFVNDGRYPADAQGVGTKYTFEQEMSNLTFYDNTLVTIAGRIVGGETEAEKTIGFGLSKNNIGKATLKLKAGGYRLNVTTNQSGTTVSYDNNPYNEAITSPTTAVASKSYRMGGDSDAVTYIQITTDSITGEFAAEVPPLGYTIEDVTVGSNVAILFESLPTIDASNPSIVYSDTITTESGSTLTFSYSTSTTLTYRSTPTFTVTDTSNAYGAYGESSYNYSDLTTEEAIDIYSVDGATNAVTYNYGYPIFVKNNTYDFLLEGYEEYYNYDADISNPTVDKVPIEGSIVTITNELSSSQSVYLEAGTTDAGRDVVEGDIVSLESNQLELDSLGQATYTWMAGFPNITAPYTRGLSIIYSNNGQELQWSGNGNFDGVVLGELPSGTNFITSGPDEVLMVLRDPPGSNSSAYWETGTTITTESTIGGGSIANAGVTTKTSFGAVTHTIVGTPITGTIIEAGIENTLEVGIEVNTNYTTSTTYATTVTTTKTISTSDSEDYVSDKGDVFIGSATNLLFGNARNVTFERDVTTGKYSLTQEDAVTVGSEFSTAFNYTQNYIEEVLIPNLYLTRNSYLQTVSASEIGSVVNTTDDYIYVTTLSADDERFGSSNTDKAVWGDLANDDETSDLYSGPSYTIIPPTTTTDATSNQDMVVWHNEQIALWEQSLADNEKAKVDAINGRSTYLSENLSFDQGASIESSVSTCSATSTTEEWSVETIILGGFDAGFEVNGNGLRVEITANVGGVVSGGSASSTEACSVTGFTLADDGLNDALSVDVLTAPDGFGAIFVTRGGQTSCPYEDAIYTKYYEPGTEISAATMQVEIPVLEADNYYATDVPSGGTATYSVEMRNDSETGDDVWFDLKVVDASNPNGASLSMDGSKLTEEGRSILVAAGSSLTKSLQLTQTEIDVLEYDNIAVVLVSQCQNDPTGLFPVIADTIYLSAQFVPSCSEITLKIDESTINMFTSDTLTLQMTDFDRSFNSFESIRIQYKYANDVSWTLGKEYVLDEADVTTSTELLPDGGTVTVQFPMSNTTLFPDGTYQFRLQTTCIFGTDGVNVESETITVTKDMAAPEVLGTPNPSDGILSAGDDISILFNEDIRNGSLTETANFLVTGVLNDAVIAHDVALRLDGTTTAAATTEADIHLANSSFAIDMWLNYTTVGTLVEHGTADNRFIVAIDEAGKLVVTIGGESYTSDDAVPSGTWCFLTLNYVYDEFCQFTATVASDASNIELFESKVVPAYTGAGVLAFGKGMEGAMHEVTLWNRARTTVEAQAEMYVGKSAATSNLVGYWKLDEGHGTSAIDAARSRHLTLAADAWYLNNTNIAAQFNGSAYLSLDISTTSVDDNDNYMFELWFRGEAQTDATLWSANDYKVGMKFNNSGQLTLMHDGSETVVSTTNYLDNAWHHVALNVLRNGTAIVYVDGTAAKQVSATLVPALQSDAIIVGANRYISSPGGAVSYDYESYFTGEIDEIRYWGATFTGDYIVDNRYNRVDVSTASGLLGYYPFETTGLDAYNQVVTAFSLTDFSDNNLGDATAVAVVESSNAPSLQEAPELTNIAFSYVASEREIVISILEEAYRIEGTTLYFTVKDVRDVNNNLMQPVTWSAYVNCNRLVWSTDEITLEIQSEETATFTAEVNNVGSDSELWTLSNLPVWLSANKTAGYLAPLSTTIVTFTVSSATSTGSYEEEVYLSGNDAIYTPLTVNLKVTAEAPAWSVNPGDFETNMNIIGQASIMGATSYDSDDLIAAFNGEVCVGLASPIYYSRYDAYYTIMTLYGNAEDSGVANITFKIWDASTGITYPAVTTSQDVVFLENNLLGSFNTPFTWNAENYIEQSISMTSGWNWISLGVEPESMAIGDVFSTINDNAYIAKGHSSFAEMSNNAWYGTLSTLEIGSMYRVQMNASDVLNMTGSVIEQEANPITVSNGWNWIAYTPMYTLGIDEAFAGVNPQTDDVVKSATGFAIYQDYEWVGTLNTLQAGMGYMFMSSVAADRYFSYPAASVYTSSSVKSATLREASSYDVIDQGLYSSNMTMVAIVKHGDDIASGADVAVFADSECRAAQVADATGMVYLTILGDGMGAELIFHVTYDGEEYLVNQELSFFDNQHYGNVTSPYVIQLNVSTVGMENASNGAFTVYLDPVTDKLSISTTTAFVSAKVCNMLGATLYESDNTTVIDFAEFVDGIYFVLLTDEAGNVFTEKVVKY